MNVRGNFKPTIKSIKNKSVNSNYVLLHCKKLENTRLQLSSLYGTDVDVDVDVTVFLVLECVGYLCSVK